MIDSDFCWAHRTMSLEEVKDRWFQKYIIGFHEYEMYSDAKLKRCRQIINHLESRDIHITQKDVLKIPVTDTYVPRYLLILLEWGLVPQGSHPRLERLVYWNYCFHLCRTGISCMKDPTEKYLLLASGKSLYDFLFFVPVAAKGRSTLQKKLLTIIPLLLDTPAGRELSWRNKQDFIKLQKEFDDVLEGEGKLSITLREQWIPSLQTLYKTEKQQKKTQTNIWKEELMMNRWHPDRIQKYNELGIDILDM